MSCFIAPTEPYNRVAARTSDSEDEYVRIKPLWTSQPRDISSFCEKELEERQVRVPVDPSETPQTIFFEIWLWTLQPPRRAESHKTVLSNCQTSDADYFFQNRGEQDYTGIVRIAPNDSSEQPSKWSEIRRIKFGSTSDFKPFVWLANDTQSLTLLNDSTLDDEGE